MWREIDLFGIYLPPLLVYLAAAAALYLPLRTALVRARAFRWTWNTPVAEISLYLCILGALVQWL